MEPYDIHVIVKVKIQAYLVDLWFLVRDVTHV